MKDNTIFVVNVNQKVLTSKLCMISEFTISIMICLERIKFNILMCLRKAFFVIKFLTKNILFRSQNFVKLFVYVIETVMYFI